MGTLRQEAKRNQQRISNIANQIVISINKAHASKVDIVWYGNVIYCQISGKKERKEEQYSEIGRRTFKLILQRLKENGYKKEKEETLELNAVRFVLKK